jgi:hypothetical protein
MEGDEGSMEGRKATKVEIKAMKEGGELGGRKERGNHGDGGGRKESNGRRKEGSNGDEGRKPATKEGR